MNYRRLGTLFARSGPRSCEALSRCPLHGAVVRSCPSRAKTVRSMKCLFCFLRKRRESRVSLARICGNANANASVLSLFRFREQFEMSNSTCAPRKELKTKRGRSRHAESLGFAIVCVAFPQRRSLSFLCGIVRVDLRGAFVRFVSQKTPKNRSFFASVRNCAEMCSS